MAAGALSDYAENKLLEHVLGKTSYSKPTTYVALYTANPSDAGGGTEVSGGSYARQTLTVDAAVSGATKPSADITYPVATASWGTITAVGVFDASTGGNLLAWSALVTSKTIATGDQVVLPKNDLTFSMD